MILVVREGKTWWAIYLKKNVDLTHPLYRAGCFISCITIKHYGEPWHLGKKHGRGRKKPLPWPPRSTRHWNLLFDVHVAALRKAWRSTAFLPPTMPSSPGRTKDQTDSWKNSKRCIRETKFFFFLTKFFIPTLPILRFLAFSPLRVYKNLGNSVSFS